MLVSIIVNCYNGEKYLKQCITSILNQTYKNFEIIFWDNQSKDNSADIAKSFKDPRIKYFYADEHKKLFFARNQALEKSKGELIAFLDTDDEWLPNRLEKQISYFNNPEVGLVYGNYYYKNEIKNSPKKIMFKYSLNSGDIFNSFIVNNDIHLLTVILRKKYLDAFEKKFDNNLQVIGDFDLFARFVKKYKAKAINDPIALRRWHGNNESITKIYIGIVELSHWLDHHSRSDIILNKDEINILKLRIKHYQLIQYKSEKKYKEYFKVFFQLSIIQQIIYVFKYFKNKIK